MESQVSPRVYRTNCSTVPLTGINVCSITLILNAAGIPKNFMIENLVSAVRQDVEKKHLMHDRDTRGIPNTWMCNKHPNNVMTIYCLTCQLPICRDCALTFHHGHKHYLSDCDQEFKGNNTLQQFLMHTDSNLVDVTPQNCTVGGSGTQIAFNSTPNKFHITLHCDKKDMISGRITVQVKCLDDDSIIQHRLQSLPNGREYTVSYWPVNTGPHVISVRVGNYHLAGSPYTVPVSTSPYSNVTMGRTVLQLGRGCFTNCNIQIWGIAISASQQVALTDCKHNCVIILNSELQFTETLGISEHGSALLQQPRGIVFTNDNILLVVDKGANRVVQFNCADGKQMATCGGYGQHNGEFNEPTGIAYNSGKVYVVDWQNYRIQVLNDDLSFDFKFGTRGNGTGQFEGPYDVAVDRNTSQVFVTDFKLNRVQMFTPSGGFISSFATCGDHGPLRDLNCIAIDDYGFILVTEGTDGHRMSIFSPQHHFITSIYGNRKNRLQFKNIRGIGILKNGHILLADYEDNCIQEILTKI